MFVSMSHLFKRFHEEDPRPRCKRESVNKLYRGSAEVLVNEEIFSKKIICFDA